MFPFASTSAERFMFPIELMLAVPPVASATLPVITVGVAFTVDEVFTTAPKR
jgi:hypothetical protein